LLFICKLLTLPFNILKCAVFRCVGSFLLGALAAKTRRPQTSLLLGTGFCGSLTTFSTFSVDALQFIDAKRVGMALVYVSVTNVGGIGAAAIAYKLFKQAK
jgi:CrcB protein